LVIKMSIKNFMSRKPRISFIAIGAVCVGIGLAVTQVQANISDSSVATENNPHHLPNEFNPKMQRIEEKLQIVKFEIKAPGEENEVMAQELDTIHSVAFKDSKINAKPVYDYTTGTSN